MSKKTERFFNFIRNFNNAIFALGFSAIILIGLAVLAYNIFWPRERNVHNIVNVDNSDSSLSTKFIIGAPDHIGGTNYSIAPLYAEQEYAGTGSSLSFNKSSNGNILNYLFIDNSTLQSAWLFNDNSEFPKTNRLILKKISLIKSWTKQNDYELPEQEIISYLYEIVKTDTNNNKRFDNEDMVTLAISSNNGANYKELLSDIILIGIKQTSTSDFIVIYKKSDIYYVTKFSIKGDRLLQDTKLPLKTPDK